MSDSSHEIGQGFLELYGSPPEPEIEKAYLAAYGLEVGRTYTPREVFETLVEPEAHQFFPAHPIIRFNEGGERARADFEEMFSSLDEWGLGEVVYIARGNGSLLLRSDDYIIRIAPPKESTRPVHPSIIQPIVPEMVKAYFKVEILPFVTPIIQHQEMWLAETYPDRFDTPQYKKKLDAAFLLKQAFEDEITADDAVKAADMVIQNLGVLRNGKIIGLDAGTVIPKIKAEMGVSFSERTKFPEQQMHIAALGMEYGKVHDVVISQRDRLR